MDYHEILSHLFVGSNPKGTEDIETLRQIGVSAVLNLQTDSDMQGFKVDWALMLAVYQARGIEFRRVPVRDFDPVDLEAKVQACVSALEELIGSGHKIYLHCTAGTGRSPSVGIAYLSLCCAWDFAAAVAHVKQCRPCTPNLEAIRAAIRNPVSAR